ncbi:MAG: hypothetical protein GXO35_05565 [Gammaproteobacteria bacterium]|nr:hypothetical protein [Gammaproteobacteria bacterium]
MSNIVDDLLQEVEQLETSTEQMNEAVQAAEQVSSDNVPQNTDLDAGLLALEAAKTAQEASVQSHLAAKASIKMVDQLKAQGLELDEFNFNWRQSIRNTSKELSAAKSSFSLIMSVIVVVNLVALSVMGYFYYLNSKESAQFKGELLDVIQTENTLFTKKITLKVDELSTLIEALSADIQKLNSTQPTQVKIHKKVYEEGEVVPTKPMAHAEPMQAHTKDVGTHKTDSNHPESSEAHTTNVSMNHHGDEQAIATAPEHHVVEKAHVDTHSTPIHAAPSISAEVGHVKPHQAESHTGVRHAVVDSGHDSHMTTNEHTAVNSVKGDASANANANAHGASSEQLATIQSDYASLKTLVEKILSEQQKLQASTLATSHTAALNPKQLKKLNDISWLVRKQGKTLKAIQASLSGKQSGKDTAPVLKSIKRELQALNQQQSHMQSQVKSLQAELTEFTAKPKEQPYRYISK